MNPTDSVRNWFGINREPTKKYVGVGTARTGRDWAEPKENVEDDLNLAQTLVAAWLGTGGKSQRIPSRMRSPRRCSDGPSYSRQHDRYIS